MLYMPIHGKRCAECGELKPFEEFSKQSSAKSGIRSRCKQCDNAHSRTYRDNNRDTLIEKDRRYRRENEEKRRESRRRYNAEHYDLVMTYYHRRKARKRGLPDTYTVDDWQRALNYWRGCCAYCGNPPGFLPGMEISREHFIPLSHSECPGTVPANIIPVCKACNSSKLNRDAAEWLTWKFGRRKAEQILARITAYFQWVAEQGLAHDSSPK